VRDNRANAAILVPDKPRPVVTFAAEELRYHVHVATGATLPIRNENVVSANAAGLLVLGPCQRTAAAGVQVDDLPPNAFRIKLSNGNLYLVGRDSGGSVLDSRNIQGRLHNNMTAVGTLLAVYEFLDRQLGVRWLWPGKLGEVIPKRKSIQVSRWDQTYRPPLVTTRLRDWDGRKGAGWSSKEVADAYFNNQAIWMRRHRFAQGLDLDYGHAFEQYWKRFGRTHPEFFALRPDGKRAPAGDPRHVQMCVSQPGFWDQVIRDWQERGDAWMNGAENDYRSGSDGDPACTCDTCRAWDGPDADSLSDRYAKFWLALQQRGREIRPDATVLGYAYGRYCRPPVETRLNDRIVVAIVPAYYFPWSDQARQEFRGQWRGWTEAAGARAYLRANWFIFGHNLPINLARKFGEDFSFACRHGLVATDFPTGANPWATQGPTLYVLARIHRRAEWPVEQILDEYYQGFSRAEPAVRAYFAHWEHVTNAVTPLAYRAGWSDKSVLPPITDNPEHRIYRWAGRIFTAPVMSKGRTLLDQAKRTAVGDPLAEKRVAFLETGLRDVQLTLATAEAFNAYQAGGDGRAYATALQTLDDYRASVEGFGVANMAYLRAREYLWDRSAAAELAHPRPRK